MNWASLGSIKLLVVEDDMFNRQLIISLLNKIQTIEVVEAENGEDALKVLMQEQIDVMLLDLHMPKMDGFETLSSIRAKEKTKDLPVIVITSDEVEKRKCYALGANNFVPKPFRLKALEETIFNQLKVA